MNRRLVALVVGLTLGWGVAAGTAWSADAAGFAKRATRLLGDLDAAYKSMDADGDQQVTQEEFVKQLGTASKGRVTGDLGAKVYQALDKNGDGHLSLEELKSVGSSAASEPAAPPEPPLEVRTWKTGAEAAIAAARLDALLDSAPAAGDRSAAGPLGDEQFLRRVTIDMTGKPPTAAEVEAFLACNEPDRRAQAIDRLLASDAFASHWAHFWKDVMQSKASSTQVIFELHRGAALESWLFSRLRANRSWAEIARGLITAKGGVYVPADERGGNVGFLLCHTGADAEVGRATDTTRVFLGIQLECAQCHDHPTDIWKRQQFHELAAYFGRVREEQVAGEAKQRGVVLKSAEKGEYAMPDKYDASKTTVVHPRFFLTGEALSAGSDDLTRRAALAESVATSPWFAKAFVNRTWGQLMGRGFVEPVDNLGPSQEPLYPEVLDELAASFSQGDFNIKELISTITRSRAYQSEVRICDTPREHVPFAGTSPMRMRGEELWDSVAQAVGPFAEKAPLPDGLRAVLERIRDPDFFTVFKRQFDYDPSLGPDEIEASVAQALMLLNNPAINAQVSATGDTPLARIVEQYPRDDEAIRQVYLQVVSRQPSEGELASCREYVQEVGDRREALEDLMWVLINSAEFRVKH